MFVFHILPIFHLSLVLYCMLVFGSWCLVNKGSPCNIPCVRDSFGLLKYDNLIINDTLKLFISRYILPTGSYLIVGTQLFKLLTNKW